MGLFVRFLETFVSFSFSFSSFLSDLSLSYFFFWMVLRKEKVGF